MPIVGTAVEGTMTIYYVEPIVDDTLIPYHPQYDKVTIPNGLGYFSSQFPEYITNVDGVPVSAVVRVLVRHDDPMLDGILVAQTTSAQDGTWRIGNLSTEYKYDVVSRLDGYNDLIYANVSPLV